MRAVETLFMTCVHFLEWLGKRVGLNYKQVSVVFNIYVQGGILFVCSCVPLIKVILCCSEYDELRRMMVCVGCLMYAVLYGYGLHKLCKRYHAPLENAFDRCVDDLLYLSEKWGMSYETLNLVIFVLGWSLCVIIHIILCVIVR